MFLKRLFRRWFPEEVATPSEPVWPEEIWARMYAMADYARGLQIGELGIRYMDVEVEVTTSSMHQLFRRIETMLSCIDIQGDPPEWWGTRNRDKKLLSLAEFYFDRRNGYRSPQQVHDKLVEKVSVIHHLIESQDIDDRHLYYHYMKREFFQVVSDIVEVLTASIALSKPE